jgi:hypothetical protein
MYIKRKYPISAVRGNTAGEFLDGDGRLKKWCYAAAAATKGTPYMLQWGALGAQNEALAAAATDVKLMVPEKTLATGDYGWFILEGEVDLTTASDAQAAVGYAWYVHTDATVLCRDAAPDNTKIDEFAVGTQVETTATTHTVYLMNKLITWA